MVRAAWVPLLRIAAQRSMAVSGPFVWFIRISFFLLMRLIQSVDALNSVIALLFSKGNTQLVRCREEFILKGDLFLLLNLMPKWAAQDRANGREVLLDTFSFAHSGSFHRYTPVAWQSSSVERPPSPRS